MSMMVCEGYCAEIAGDWHISWHYGVQGRCIAVYLCARSSNLTSAPSSLQAMQRGFHQANLLGNQPDRADEEAERKPEEPCCLIVLWE
jgi:hypothetical protein